MKISTYKEPLQTPKTKEDKIKLAKIISLPNSMVERQINTLEDLVHAITTYPWSPGIFKDGTRNMKNFISTDIMALDIDNGMTIDDAIKRCCKLDVVAIIAPTVNHTEEAPRFRIILPLLKVIKDKEVFNSTWETLSETFPELDSQCSDTSRFYFQCLSDDVTLVKGKNLLEPVVNTPKNNLTYGFKGLSEGTKPVKVGEDMEDVVKLIYGESKPHIPEPVAEFIKGVSTGFPGKWHTMANRFLYTLTLQGIDSNILYEVFKTLSPQPLDSKDEHTFKYAIRDGLRDRKEKL